MFSAMPTPFPFEPYVDRWEPQPHTRRSAADRLAGNLVRAQDFLNTAALDRWEHRSQRRLSKKLCIFVAIAKSHDRSVRRLLSI
jgi:hypothetical protein